MNRGRRSEREADGEYRPNARFAFALDRAAVSLDDGVRDRQSQAAALGFDGAGLSDSEKPFEDSWNVFFSDADSLILEPDANLIVGTQSDGQPCARRRILDRIIDEDQEELAKECTVAPKENIALQFPLDAYLLVVCQRRCQPA